MEGIRVWAFSLCAAMAACGISRMILPKSNLQKVFGITVSAFFLCVILSPAILSYPDFKLQAEESALPDIRRRAEALAGAADSQAEQAGLMSVEKIIREKLSEMGINGGDAAINIITNGQHVRADIVLDNAYEDGHEQIRENLSRALGFDVRLGYSHNGLEDSQ